MNSPSRQTSLSESPRPPAEGEAAPVSASDAPRAESREGSFVRNREPRLVTPRGTPVGRVRITLHTDFAQRVYRRTWDRLKGDLYVLTVRTRMAEQAQASAAIESIISEAFNKARTDLAADLERTEVLRDHAQVSEFPEYEDRLETTATFSTPRAREFLALIQQMDQLLMLYDALWLAGFAQTDERVHRSYNWQRRLIKITNRLRELANRTRVSLSRQAERPSAESAAASAAGGDTGTAPLDGSSTDVHGELLEEGAASSGESEDETADLEADPLDPRDVPEVPEPGARAGGAFPPQLSHPVSEDALRAATHRLQAAGSAPGRTPGLAPDASPSLRQIAPVAS
jgi:hypothetical protein